MNSASEKLGARLAHIATDQRAILAVLVIAVFLAFAIRTPSFLNGQFVIFPLLRDTAVITIVGLAQLATLSIGHLNLAVGRMAAVGAMVAGFTYERLGFGLTAGLILGIASGALLGALTGYIIVKSQVNAFIVTLAMDFALLGLVTFTYISITDAAAFTVKPDGMDTIRQGSLADICLLGWCGPSVVPLILFPALLVVAIMGFVYHQTRFGRELLATGGNVRAARLSGIPVNARIIQAHTLSGALSGLGGIFLAYVNGSFSAAIGNELLLPSFLGPLLAGTLLTGGVVGVFGTMIGTLLWLIIRQGLLVEGIGLETLNIALGVILLLALSADKIRTSITGLFRRRKVA
ncbi:CUT2 ABC transporter permease [Pontimonas salivibrio]|uniref:CUT2 ABC transporter permease n=1 Tax=Pontimonas salivibrio TaxID=1159327 RepID=A0A2L2BRS8_9MICO|nr:ABC transporter permease [Pontimonas salivibrio]AVG24312.1 CUT2 ABC transporter permease [Pontimonas salivibrio]